MIKVEKYTRGNAKEILLISSPPELKLIYGGYLYKMQYLDNPLFALFISYMSFYTSVDIRDIRRHFALWFVA